MSSVPPRPAVDVSDPTLVVRWDELPVDHPMELIARRRVMGEHLMVSEVHLTAGFELASHHHPNEQFVLVLAGRCRFGLGEGQGYREVEVTGGSVLRLPPHLPHSCRALEDSWILDLFSPPSEFTGVDGKS